ncbi:MAG: transcription termination/antitermination factor NusG [Bacteroidales bacterium]|nr:transcription termination/antitermination factor NusG [Bacteroidales bacterium]
MSGQVKKWYVVKTIAGKERKAKEYIDNEVGRMGLTDFVSNVLIPTEKVYSFRNGKKVSKDKTLFPGYIFVEAALESHSKNSNKEGEIIHIIRNIPNVLDFVTEKDGKPIPMQPSEVERMLGKVDESMGNNEELLEPFVIGEEIKIIEGPFKNFTGIIEELNDEKKKLKVVVKIFGRKTPVELSFIQVEKLLS